MTHSIRAGDPELHSTPAASDTALVERVRRGEPESFSMLMHRHNRRLFRVARSIVGSDNDAQDVVQHAYVCAYVHLGQFAGESAFSTWLTRIVINEALARQKSARRARDLAAGGPELDWRSGGNASATPEDDVARRELASLLEAAIDELPESYRITLVLREIEGLSTAEVADCLEISEEAVRVRLHRARALLRDDLCDRVGPAAPDVFSFGGERCRRLSERVLETIVSLWH